MKKLSLIIVAIGFISLVACKKDRTCTCTVVMTQGSTSASGTYTTKYTKVKKGDVRDKCLSYTETSGTGTAMQTDAYTCTLSK